MLDDRSRSLAASVTGLVLVALLTLPHIRYLLSKLPKPKSEAKTIYEDEDGVATEKSCVEFSTKTPKTLLAIFSVLGFSSAVVQAVLGTLHVSDRMFMENWLNFAQWALVLIQTAPVLLTRNSVVGFGLGIYTAISCMFLLSVLLFQDGILAKDESERSMGPTVEVVVRISQLTFSILTGFAGLSLPRRPHIFYNGHPVDGMYTDSALGRYTFAWVGHLLRLAREKGHMDLEDLPKMDHYTRSKDLSQAWAQRDHPRALMVELFLEHKWPFIVQWILTLIQAFGLFAPQYITFHILRILEARQPGIPVRFEAWIWVIALTIASVGSGWIESWLYWISWSELAIPIRAQLSALIFQKAMRRKDVKGASKSKTIGNAAEISEAALGDATADKKLEVGDEDESNPKGKQSTINLIGVDTKRVSDFCSYNNYFPGSVFKLIICFLFLSSIIGWQALLAGFAAMSLTIPLNIYFSKRYAAAQDRLMKIRDVKMAVVTEALQGIRQIKFSAIESNWYDKIGKVRAKELTEQWAVNIADTFLLFCWVTSPIVLAAASLSVYALIYGELTPSIAFTAIGVFGGLEVTLAVIPELTTDLIDAVISVRRIEEYLGAPEISKNTNDAPNISFEDASFAWPSDEDKEQSDERYVLRNVNISFPEKELSVISGKTGTGKSLLLAAILGEVDILGGKIKVPQPPNAQKRRDHAATREDWIIPSSVAFVAQIPWIENASIRDNIVFGLPYDDYRYKKVLEVCALKKDLDMLTDGESTEIGANGINLSGGQRWRVTFARALYSRAGILVLDDIFSAVDAHVGRFIFENGLTGELAAGRTRILVTHHVALCKSMTKYVVELGEGTVEHAGLTAELEESGMLQKILSHEENEASFNDEDATQLNSEESSDAEVGQLLKKVDSKKLIPKKFVEDELRERGRVKTSVYLDYLKASGGVPFWSLALGLFVAVQVLMTGRSWWLKLWTGDNQRYSAARVSASSYSLQVLDLAPSLPNSSLFASTRTESGDLRYYLGVYILISVLASIIGTLRFFYVFTGSIRASKRLFDKLCFTVLRTPLRWIDTVPLGRILNRFTADFNTVDSRLAINISFGASNVFRLIGVIVAGVFVSPWIIFISVALLGICVYIARLYIAGARETKRLESNAKSPVFEQFGSALTGVGTIRAFDKTDVYVTRMFSKIDNHTTSYWHLWAFNRWMGWRMSLVGGFFATIVAGMIIILPNIDASLAGFALSFALAYGDVVMWTIRHYANMELDMNAAERIVEYSNLPTESLEGADPPAAWPSEGRMEVIDLVAGYAADLPPVLKGLSFRVERNERIGVVGRTGAGKSSLTLALFRFLEARQGSIHIDGLDISKIKLHALRSRLAIIPQDPVLFSGTVRSNLDAFDQHSDIELRDALERVHLVNPSSFNTTPGEPVSSAASTTQKNINVFSSLSSPITEGGLNLSQGQRQLLCLARAIVSRPKIMILDEATSAVDMDTDALIQRSIREEFGDSTLLVIAHRLSTIADFDKILVLGDGRVEEFGPPKQLMGLEKGVFRGMVRESGERGKLEGLILGETSD